MKKRSVVMCLVFGMAVWQMMLPVSAQQAGKDAFFEISDEKVIRNKEGRIVGVDVTTQPSEVEYRNVTLAELVKEDVFREYEKLGLFYDKENKRILFAGMEIVALSDTYQEGTALDYFSEDQYYSSERYEKSDRPQIYIMAVRDEDYHLLYFEFSRQEYLEDDEIWTDDALEGTEYMDYYEEEKPKRAE